jgi:hypothetical protein
MPPSRHGAVSGSPPTHFGAFGEAPTASPVPLILAALSSGAAVVLLLIGWLGDAGSTTQISRVTIAGWFLGAVLTPSLFAWFRTADMKARSDIRFVEPSWRPSRVAALVAMTGWVASVGHAWLIASSVART